MQFTGMDDDNLPDDVKEMSDDEKKAWVKAYNSSIDDCEDEEDVCEEKASKAAYTAAKNASEEPSKNEKDKSRNLFEQLGRTIVDVVKTVLPTAREERMVSIPGIFYTVSDAVWIFGAYLIDVYYDDGNLFALATKEGKLFRYNVTIEDDGTVSVEDGDEIPVGASAERSHVTVVKQGDKYRWLVIACTSVIDRDGEIDSTELFDDFIHRIETKEEDYPYLTFFHVKEKMRMGMADYIARDGNVLVVSGLFDDSKLAELTRKGLEEEPEYWGISIGYLAEEPVLEEVTKGIKVPVYRAGILEEISILPEHRAAAWFTAVKPMEVTRGMKDEIMTALEKLVGKDDAEQFEELVDGVNERIASEKMIVRTGNNAEGENTSDNQPIADKDENSEVHELVIDDETIGEIAEQVLSSEDIQKLKSTLEDLAKEVGELTRLTKESTKSLKDAVKRVELLEREDDEKQKEWQSDLPAKKKIIVTHRARNDRLESSVEVDGEEVGYDQVAADTLQNLSLK